jgi:hypothetical protein
MNPILFLSLVIILSAALPWWPYSAYGRSRHHRPWDWLLDTPSREDYRTWNDKHLDKHVDERDEVHRATPEASQNAQLLRQFEERWIEAASNRSALSPTV